MSTLANQAEQFSPQTLSHYFDGLAKDHCDRGLHQERGARLWRLRVQMQKLPDAAFNTSLQAMEAIVEHALHMEGKSEQAREGQGKQAAASLLYEKSRQSLKATIKPL